MAKNKQKHPEESQKTKLSAEQGGGNCNSYDRELISHTNSYKSIGK